MPTGVQFTNRSGVTECRAGQSTERHSNRWASMRACLATPGYAGFVRPDMICAGVASGKIDQCNGDSGGPLMQQGSGSSAPVLVGIVEGGDGCGLAHTPGVYVYVPAYRDWIARTIGRGSLRKGRAILAAAGRKTT